MEKLLHKDSEAKAYAAGTRCLVLGILGIFEACRNCRGAIFVFFFRGLSCGLLVTTLSVRLQQYSLLWLPFRCLLVRYLKRISGSR